MNSLERVTRSNEKKFSNALDILEKAQKKSIQNLSESPDKTNISDRKSNFWSMFNPFMCGVKNSNNDH